MSTYQPYNPKLNKPRGSPRDKKYLPKSRGFVKDMLSLPGGLIEAALSLPGEISSGNERWEEHELDKQARLKHKMWLASWRDRAAQRDKQIQAEKAAMFQREPQDPHGGGQTFSLSEWEPGSKGLSPEVQSYLSKKQKAAPRPVASTNIPKPDKEYLVDPYRRPEEGGQR